MYRPFFLTLFDILTLFLWAMYILCKLGRYHVCTLQPVTPSCSCLGSKYPQSFRFQQRNNWLCNMVRFLFVLLGGFLFFFFFFSLPWGGTQQHSLFKYQGMRQKTTDTNALYFFFSASLQNISMTRENQWTEEKTDQIRHNNLTSTIKESNNSLARRCGNHFKSVIFKHMLQLKLRLDVLQPPEWETILPAVRIS